VESVLGETRYVVLSGPSHAEEVSRRVPTAVVAASADLALAELVQQSFINDNFRVYTGTDVVGVELGGALKNVMAIAAGIIDGMKLGDNPKAALMTRGISEMGRLGELLGGKAQTFSGLSGIGDLIVTCTSGHSRNRHVGEELGRGKKLPEILASMGMVVAEGVTTAKGAHALARRVGAETPIIDEIYAVLHEGRNVPDAIRNLMSRSAKPE
ncbi:NAD(P)H-dependent glycerol-3-phosphate dehydrogenase, partial [uncultured Victivallis sp.]